MSVYNNLTGLQNVTKLNHVWSFAETASGGIMSGTFMIAIFIVIFMSMIKYGFSRALLVASFPCFILSSFLTFAGVLNVIFPLTFIVLIGFTLLFMITVGKKENFSG